MIAFASRNEPGTIESLRKKFQELSSNRELPYSRLVKAAGLEHLDITRNFNYCQGCVSSSFTRKGACNVRRADPPFHKDAIRIETTMQRACARVAVVVLEIPANNATKFDEVEVSIPGLKWIKSPCDQRNPSREGVITLGELEARANSFVAGRGRTASIWE